MLKGRWGPFEEWCALGGRPSCGYASCSPCSWSSRRHSSARDDVPRGIRQASRLDGGPRVRTSDRRVTAAIAEGAARSSSFLDVINDVEQHDVIVYVEMQPQLRGRLSGALTWVTRTKAFRYVRVALNPDLTGSLLVAALAHELQHVAEVGRAASVVDTASLSRFYRTIGVNTRLNSDEWDTEAAQAHGRGRAPRARGRVDALPNRYSRPPASGHRLHRNAIRPVPARPSCYAEAARRPPGHRPARATPATVRAQSAFVYACTRSTTGSSSRRSA